MLASRLQSLFVSTLERGRFGDGDIEQHVAKRVKFLREGQPTSTRAHFQTAR